MTADASPIISLLCRRVHGWRTLILLAAVAMMASDDCQGVTIRLDYSRDSNGFFDDPTRRMALEAAADVFAGFPNQLPAVRSGRDSSGQLNVLHVELSEPASDEVIELTDVSVEADTVLIFAGGRDMERLGFGFSGEMVGEGSQEFLWSIERHRLPWGGSVAFDIRPSYAWHFGIDEMPGPTEIDFLSVAIHEIAHVFGFGTAPAWDRLVDETRRQFLGAASAEIYGDEVPLSDDLQHWASELRGAQQDLWQTAAMQPGLVLGHRQVMTNLDMAGLVDIGWELPHDLPGDADGDGDVDAADLSTVAMNWTGALEIGEGIKRYTDGDFDFDQDVDSADLNIVIVGWTGAASRPAIAGEPHSSALWFFVILLCGRRRSGDGTCPVQKVRRADKRGGQGLENASEGLAAAV